MLEPPVAHVRHFNVSGDAPEVAAATTVAAPERF
jgi:hypothetical protein